VERHSVRDVRDFRAERRGRRLIVPSAPPKESPDEPTHVGRDQARRAEAVAFLRFCFGDEERGVDLRVARRAVETIAALLAGRLPPDDEVTTGFRIWRELGGDRV
jgi:hypothetical protein